MNDEELVIFKSKLKVTLAKRIGEALEREDMPNFILNMKLFGKLFAGEMDTPSPDKIYKNLGSYSK